MQEEPYFHSHSSAVLQETQVITLEKKIRVGKDSPNWFGQTDASFLTPALNHMTPHATRVLKTTPIIDDRATFTSSSRVFGFPDLVSGSWILLSVAPRSTRGIDPSLTPNVYVREHFYGGH